jgi:hypothetical protein
MGAGEDETGNRLIAAELGDVHEQQVWRFLRNQWLREAKEVEGFRPEPAGLATLVVVPFDRRHYRSASASPGHLQFWQPPADTTAPIDHRHDRSNLANDVHFAPSSASTSRSSG